jgi:hypothetical protein
MALPSKGTSNASPGLKVPPKWARFVALLVAALWECAGVANATVWNAGDIITYNQAAWSLLPQATTTLINKYGTVYAPTFGVLEIGIAGGTGFSAIFSSSDVVTHYLPATGAPAALTTDLNNPSTTSAGVFGGDVLALQLNVDFADADALSGSASLHFGDLALHDLTGATASLNGQSIRSLAAIANTALGGGSTGFAISDLDALADLVNAAFNDGTVTTFALEHLDAGPANPGGSIPEPATIALLGAGVAGLAVARGRRRYRAI